MQHVAFKTSSLLWDWLASHARTPLGPAALWQLCLLPVLFALAVLACRSDPAGRQGRNPLFFGLTLLAILLGVLPSLAKDHLSVDEACFLANARKLAFDPVFYRSVDAGTSGPLNIYVLTIPAWFGAPITYVSARLTGAVLMFGLVVCLYLCCSGFLGKRSARLAILPLLGVVVLSTHFDFLHYSSERLSIFLTGLSLALLSRQYLGSDPYSGFRMFTLGVITAAMCFSKIQSAPIAVTLGLAALLHALMVRRRAVAGAAYLVLGAAAVPVTFCALFLYYGVFDEFWQSYVAQNLAYSELTSASLPAKLLATVGMFLVQAEFRWYDVGLLFCGLVLLLELARRRPAAPQREGPGNPVTAPNGWQHKMLGKASGPGVFVLVLLAACLYAAAKPGNPFEHYLLLLLAPWTLCIAAGIAWAQHAGVPATSRRQFVLLAFAVPSVLRLLTAEVTSYQYHPQFDPEASPLVRLAKAHASEGEFLVVWGWRCGLYVNTDLLQGTRFANSGPQIEPSKQIAFFREQYLRDFVASNPPLFLDTVGPGSFKYQDRTRAGHETFPELARIIQAKYSLVAEGRNVRAYLRNDR